MDTDPMVVELGSVLVDRCRRHMAFDAIRGRRDRANGVGLGWGCFRFCRQLRRWLFRAMALDALINVELRLDRRKRGVGIVARGTFQLSLGLEIALASKQSDRLETR